MRAACLIDCLCVCVPAQSTSLGSLRCTVLLPCQLVSSSAFSPSSQHQQSHLISLFPLLPSFFPLLIFSQFASLPAICQALCVCDSSCHLVPMSLLLCIRCLSVAQCVDR